MGDSQIGTRLTDREARSIGAIQSFVSHGSNDGVGIYANSSGTATPTKTDQGTELSAGADAEQVWSETVTIPQHFTSGIVFVFNCFKMNQQIGNLASEQKIGSGPGGQRFAAVDENMAAFNPGAGQSTSGNVRVERSDTITNGSVTYPAIDQEFIWANVAIDNDRGQTEFYVEKNPLTDSPDEVIQAVPKHIMSVGGRIIGNDADLSETLTMALSGYVYIP